MDGNIAITVSRVSITSEEDIEQWSQRLGCTNADLIEAVKTIGTCPVEVEIFLKVERKEKWKAAFTEMYNP